MSKNSITSDADRGSLAWWAQAYNEMIARRDEHGRLNGYSQGLDDGRESYDSRRPKCWRKCVNEGDCLDWRIKGCYCANFERWRGGEPHLSQVSCSKHEDLPALRRDDIETTKAGHDVESFGRCWWCILERGFATAEKTASDYYRNKGGNHV